MTTAQYVVFRPDRTALAALPIEHVVETMRPLHVEPLAGAPPFVAGAAIVRGKAVPVLDAAALFGGAEDTAAHRWIAFAVGERVAVLAVHAVVGVQMLTLNREAAPPLLSRSMRGAITELAALDGQLLAVLQAARLVGEDVWRALEAVDGR